MANFRFTSSVGNVTSNQLVIDMKAHVHDLEPNAAPFLKLLDLGKANKRVVTNAKFEHLEQQRIGVRTTASAAYTSASTVIAVADGTIFNTYDLVKNVATSEVMRITTISVNNLTVTRGFGETAAALIASGDSLIRLSSAASDGDTSVTPLIRPLDTDFNYIQIHRLPFGSDWTIQATKNYSGDELARLRKEKGVEFLRAMEHQFLFGERAISGGTGNQPIRQTRGLQKFISTNVHTVGGTLTQSLFEQYLESDFRYGSSMKVGLLSARTISVVNGWAYSKLQVDQEMSKKFGVNVMTYISGHGELKIIKHNLLEGNTYSGYMFIVDPTNVGYASMQGLDYQINSNIQDPSAHTLKEEWFAYAGLDMMLEKTHAIYTGITG